MSNLAALGLFPIEVNARSRALQLGAPRLSPGDLAVGLRILATLLDSGLPMRRVASIFGPLAPTSWNPIVNSLVPALREGRSLSSALGESAISFPPVIIGIVRAGEAGATVSASLRAAADLADSAAATRSAIRSALAYPVLLALAGGVSITVLVTLVLPRFAAILGDLNQSLPPATRLVLGLASAAHRIGPLVLVIAAAAFALLHVWLQNPTALAAFHGALLRVPVIGMMRHSGATSRCCAALAALMHSGVPIAQALTYGAAAAGDAAVAARVSAARKSIITGRTLGSSLEESRAFTAASLRLIRAGEESGRVPDMLAHAAQLERDRATEGVRRFVRLLEPALILIFAGIVAVVAAALLQAVYSVRPI